MSLKRTFRIRSLVIRFRIFSLTALLLLSSIITEAQMLSTDSIAPQSNEGIFPKMLFKPAPKFMLALPDTCMSADSNTFHDSLGVFSYNLPDSLLTYAQRFLGIRYRYGGATIDGFDCSGFTRHVFDFFDIPLPRSSFDQGQQGISIPKHQARRGDLIFFKGRNLKHNRIGHVGIVVDNNEGVLSFIHASRTRGISFETTESPYYKPRYVGIRRVFELETFAEEQDPNKEKVIADLNKIPQRSLPNIPEFHVVGKGDSLFRISRKYGVSVSAIQKINNIQGDRIFPGQIIKLTAAD